MAALHFRALFLACSLALCGAGAQSAETGGADLLVQANAALAAGRYADAETLSQNGLAVSGTDELTQRRLLVARGLARQSQDRAEDAMEDFTRALFGNSLPPGEQARVLFDRGLALDGLGQLGDAIGDYSAALRADPAASYALNNRANVYRRQGHLDDARRDYNAALALSGVNAQYPYYGLGQIAEVQNDKAAARDFYRRAADADPGYQPAQDRLLALGPDDQDPLVLRPPAGQKPILLRAPDAAPAVAMTAPARPSLPTQNTSTQRAPGKGAPLRTAIMDATAAGGAWVQLGAWRSDGEALAGWAKAKGKAGALLDGLTPSIQAADLPGKGRYYRLRLNVTGSAATFCAALAQKGQDCLAVRD